jgi:LmbE family N-acetylglucosaminyl deacetylase
VRTLLALSPHLDDAVFSAGATIAQASRQGWRTIIATVFTGNVAQPTGFALACQLDKGLASDIDYMAIRRAEDTLACTRVGAEALHLPFLEAPHRGYESAQALFAGVRPDDKARLEVSESLDALVQTIRPDRVLAPLGLGGHVDHLIVRDAVAALAASADVSLWEDWPYVERLESHNRKDGRLVLTDSVARAAKLSACAAYETQLGFQFGGAEKLREMLASQSGEWFHAEQ